MSAITSRPAVDRDIAGVLEIWNPLISQTAVTFTTREKSADDVRALFADRAAPGGGLLVAGRRGNVMGFACAGQFRCGPGYRHTLELSVHVAEGARRAGLGRQLVRALMAQAGAAGAHTLYAGISGENPAAVTFHEAIGFAPVAVLPEAGRKFDRWMDLHLLMVRLPGAAPGAAPAGA